MRIAGNKPAQAMPAPGKTELPEGSLEGRLRLPFDTDFTPSMLFFQDDVDASVGGAHETGNYPGAQWLWPYAFWYRIPPKSTSPNADIQVIAITTIIFLILVFAPFIPVLNHIPRRLGIYCIIWRDWYARKEEG